MYHCEDKNLQCKPKIPQLSKGESRMRCACAHPEFGQLTVTISGDLLCKVMGETHHSKFAQQQSEAPHTMRVLWVQEGAFLEAFVAEHLLEVSNAEPEMLCYRQWSVNVH